MLNFDDISPGVRELVRRLNRDGFTTCDSGDGSLASAGMECAWDMPMVAFHIEDRRHLFERADQLLAWCRRNLNGEALKRLEQPMVDEGICLEATYHPNQDACTIVLTNVRDSDLVPDPLLS